MSFKSSAKSFGGSIWNGTKKTFRYLDNRPWLFSTVIGLMLNFIIECLHRHSLWEGILHVVKSPLPFLFNALVIATTMAICSIFKKKHFLWLFASTVFLGFGIANCVLLLLRITPLEWADLQVVKISLITKYLNYFEIALIVIVIVAALAGLVVFFVKSPKSKINYLREGITIGVFIAVLAASLLTFRATDVLLSKHTKNLANAYKQYGFNYCFLCSMFDLGIDEPPKYTQSDIDAITSRLDNAAAMNTDREDQNALVQNNTKSPNVIFLQLETFFDVNHLSTVEFSEDPIPNFTELQNKFSSGYLGVPSIGAGTANTEFEIISGMSLEHFGMGEYPYKTILQTDAAESICYNLKNHGYTSHAIHNNTAVFYDRNIVFSNLGFNTFTSLEYMQDVDYTVKGWAKDNVLIGCINDCLNSTDGSDMVYTVTVQAHGKYPSDYEGELPISVTGFSENDAIRREFEYYVNQLHEVDRFVADLLTSLQERGERTVVVMYGDHLPSFEINAEDLEGGNLFATEYVIWDNFGLHKENGNIEAYQLGAHMMELIGFDDGVLTKLHQNFKNGEQYLEWLETLEYDMLYGEKYALGGKDNYPYQTTDLKMGVKDVTISDVDLNADGTVTVKGENFTDYSRIILNDTTLSTVLVDNFTLTTEKDVKLTTGDHLAVIQVDNSGNALSSSKYYLIGGTEDKPTVTVGKDNIIYRTRGFKLSTAIAIIVSSIAVIALSTTVITVIRHKKEKAKADTENNSKSL
ncbi:MAG: sulfatase-like hydrolase/transferase [Clostridia bacterium]|nr:sulfatase-like hydrolase/transferase [Clostridia bacterium]